MVHCLPQQHFHKSSSEEENLSSESIPCWYFLFVLMVFGMFGGGSYILPSGVYDFSTLKVHYVVLWKTF